MNHKKALKHNMGRPISDRVSFNALPAKTVSTARRGQICGLYNEIRAEVQPKIDYLESLWERFDRIDDGEFDYQKELELSK